MKSHFRFEFSFPRNYEAKVLESAPLPHPVEELYHFPVELAEGDRAGAYVRVVPPKGPAWTGFFAQGFDLDQVVTCVASCPDPDSLCVVAGGYAYVVKASDPNQWLQIEQRPVADLRSVSGFSPHESGLLLFTGFTSITALGRDGIVWTTERLSWEGVRLGKIVFAQAPLPSRAPGGELHGFGWDPATDKEDPFVVDLATGKHTGGARPRQTG
jgi:hypothetical protein